MVAGSGGASREVVFTLKVVPDASIQASFDRAKRYFDQYQETIDKAAGANGRMQARMANEHLKAQERLWGGLSKVAEQEERRTGQAFTRLFQGLSRVAARESQKTQQQYESAFNGLARVAARVQQQMATEQAKAQERLWGGLSRVAARESQNTQRQFERAFTGLARVAEKTEKDRIRSAERAAAAEQQALRRNEQEYQRYGARVVGENNKLNASLKNTGEGLIQLLRGVAQLGLSGEKDVQKLLNAILAIEGAVNVAKGSITVVESLAKSYRAYTASVEAAAAEQLLMRARVANAAARVAGGPVGSGAGSALTGVAGGLGARAGAGLIPAGAATTVAAFVAALTGATAGLVVIAEEARRIHDGGFSSKSFGATVLATSESQSSAVQSLFGLFPKRDFAGLKGSEWQTIRSLFAVGTGLTEFDQAERTASRAAESEAALARRRESAAGIESRRAEQEGLAARLREIEFQRQYGTRLDSARSLGNTRQLGGALDAAIRATGVEAERARREGNQTALTQAQERLVELKREELQLQQQLHREAIQEGQQRVSDAERELRLRQQTLGNVEESIKARARAFNALPLGEQSRIGQTLKRVAAGDIAGISPRALAEARLFGGQHVENVETAKSFQNPILQKFLAPFFEHDRLLAERGVREAQRIVVDAKDFKVQLEVKADQVLGGLSDALEQVIERVFEQKIKAALQAVHNVNAQTQFDYDATQLRRVASIA